MRLAEYGKRILSLAAAAVMVVSACTMVRAESVDPGTGTNEEEMADRGREQGEEYVGEKSAGVDGTGGVEGMNPTEPVAEKVASVGGEYYSALDEALAAAQNGDTVTLLQDVALDAVLTIGKSVVLDLGTHTISGSEAFTKAEADGSGDHLAEIRAGGVTIENGVLQAGPANSDTLDVYRANGVVLRDLTLDNAKSCGGAPLIVASSDVTLAGSVTFVTGEDSWYSVNVNGADNPTKLALAENARVTLGNAATGIRVDRSTALNMVTLDFGPGARVTGSTAALVLNTDAADNPSEAVTVTGLGNTNLAETPVAGAVARIGDTYYPSLAGAIRRVGADETITLLCDVPDAEGLSVESNKRFTVDFAGHTYTLNGPDNGSFGTETNGFQLRKDSTITFKNGTIRISEKNGTAGSTHIQRIIQNYADLTLEDMQIYAANQFGGEDYALSLNNGDVTFRGSTSIYMSDPAAATAFDVYYWAQSYPDGTRVTFAPDYTGTIQGAILYDSTDRTKAALKIQGSGCFQGIRLSAATVNGADVSVCGGYFIEDPSDCLPADQMAVPCEDKEGYNYQVVEKAPDAAKVVPGETAMANPAAGDAGADAGEIELAGKLGEALGGLTINREMLHAAANKAANANTITADAGRDALAAADISVRPDDTVTIVLQPYLEITLLKTSVQEAQKSFTLDITPMHRTIATTADVENDEAIVMDGSKENAVVMGDPLKLAVTKPVEMTIRLPDGFAADGTPLYVLHEKEDGTLYQYTDEVGGNLLTFTNPHGFSVFTVSTTEFDLAAMYIESDTDDTASAPAETPAPAATPSPAATPAPSAGPRQSGGSIAYYPCPACGYHNWTAAAEGYKCDHCGYVEAVKQLSGYGNVKGVFDPGNSAAAAPAASGGAASAAAIPQTGDELPLTGLVVAAIAALVGLGVVIVLKKRGDR